ncbi:MAG TPA: DUF1775 domain-containing protein [Ilumatobacteraceae bacterium]
MILRLLAFAIALCSVLAAFPELASAHAVFVNPPGSVAIGSDVTLTMNVPHEREEGIYNVDVAVRLPQGWNGVSCQSKATWTCSIAPSSGYDVVHFAKDASAAPAEDETFVMTVHAGGSAGTVSFPTLQTYSTGEVVGWVGAPGSAEPAPVLQAVGGGAGPTTTVLPTTTAVAPPTSPPPPTTASPNTTSAATTTVAPTTVAPTTTTSVARSTSTSSTSIPSTTSSVSPTTVATTDTASTATTAAITAEPISASSQGDGGSSTWVIGVVLAVVAAGASGGLLWWRRRAGSTGA